MKNIFPDVQKSDFVPTQLGIWKWHFPEDRIGETVTIDGKKIKKLLTMDINIPSSSFAEIVNGSASASKTSVFAKNYPCTHACPGCFNNADLKNPVMTLEEILSVIDQGIELGLESVKFLGPGELLENPDIFRILDELQNRNIVIGIFTKGAVLGSDELSQPYHEMGSQEFFDRIIQYENTTFLVGGRSFDPDIENKFIPTRNPILRNKFNYHATRNLAIERLCHAGMNADPQKQRLSIQANPVTPETIDGIMETFMWATERNIPTCVTTTMVSGKGHKLIKGNTEKTFELQYENLAADIYGYLIESGVMTMDRIKHEGVSPYIGMAPCNQLTHGMYVHYDGEVWRCPGNDTPNFVVRDDVRKSSLLDIWTHSSNYKLQRFNNRCVKDSVSIPKGFYRRVLEKVEA